jgi:hypothetical protein
VVRVLDIKEAGDVWVVDLSIYEGVYRLDRYPVRVEGVPLPPADLPEADRRRVMGEFVTDAVMRHMRRGSLPPRGTRLDGAAVWAVPDAGAAPGPLQ